MDKPTSMQAAAISTFEFLPRQTADEKTVSTINTTLLAVEKLGWLGYSADITLVSATEDQEAQTFQVLLEGRAEDL